ncbi:hypothetical protein SAMN05444000_12839 [Shimia gijangensis]|uniref:Uncharacterized protein n=1 Tax=Shimia gijangensis TaxID=1470563 RepID=A0A1M6SAN7_9RHOB|nr:hypothetical protein SAMN05444000_12839 [Shimia gijangensis]
MLTLVVIAEDGCFEPFTSGNKKADSGISLRLVRMSPLEEESRNWVIVRVLRPLTGFASKPTIT